jgi:hypothetical protein
MPDYCSHGLIQRMKIGCDVMEDGYEVCRACGLPTFESVPRVKLSPLTELVPWHLAAPSADSRQALVETLLSLYLDRDEVVWFVTDQASVQSVPKQHVIVVTDRRLLVLGLPDCRLALNLDRSDLSIDSTTDDEYVFKRQGENLAESERTVVVTWEPRLREAMTAALKGLINGERPKVLRSVPGLTLQNITYLGGHGCPVTRGKTGSISVTRSSFKFFGSNRIPAWEVPIDEITEIEFSGPGAWKKGGGAIGGGFGVVGAAEGMLIASALNALTTKKGVTTIIRIAASDDMAAFWRHDDQYTPDRLRIELSWLVAKTSKQLRSESFREHQTPAAEPGGTDLVARLTQLGSLRTQGLLTDEEFAAAKARLLNGPD